MSSPQRKRIGSMNSRRADRHLLYETAVQRPQVVIGFIEDLFRLTRDRKPVLLREDFCGTANLSSCWAASDPLRRSIGVDNDAGVLAWATSHNVQPLGAAAGRVELIESDVLGVGTRADVLVSLNFSHFIYKQRDELRAYLKHAWRCIKPGGLMVLDAFGGPGSITPCADERPFGTFTYIWEQKSFNPLTHEIDCRIHFRFPNGSTQRNAFRYDWRMWSLPEIKELLAEVGFGEVGVYFESEEGFIGDVDAIDCDAWVAYVVALRD